MSKEPPVKKNIITKIGEGITSIGEGITSGGLVIVKTCEPKKPEAETESPKD